MKKIFSISICLIILLNFLIVVSAAEDKTVVDDVKTASEFNGSYYKVYDEVELNWTEASEFCESLGGHLVTITSEAEQKFVESLLQNHNKNFYWLGAYEDQNQWIWVQVPHRLSTYPNSPGISPPKCLGADRYH